MCLADDGRANPAAAARIGLHAQPTVASGEDRERLPRRQKTRHPPHVARWRSAAIGARRLASWAFSSAKRTSSQRASRAASARVSVYRAHERMALALGQRREAGDGLRPDRSQRHHDRTRVGPLHDSRLNQLAVERRGVAGAGNRVVAAEVENLRVPVDRLVLQPGRTAGVVEAATDQLTGLRVGGLLTPAVGGPPRPARSRRWPQGRSQCREEVEWMKRSCPL